MSSDDLIALASDALRGLLQSVLPAGVPVVVGAPEDTGAGLWLHLLRITEPAEWRQAPSAGEDPAARRRDLHLRMDYLVAGAADEALQAHALLGAALRVITDQPVLDRTRLAPLLSQPHRLTATPASELVLRWRLLDLSLAEQATLWIASAAAQRAGLFVQGDVVWRRRPDAQPGSPVLERHDRMPLQG
ncbi:Pvc16 family protein [Luteimonas sp. RIT-PG2_3]